jgi:predicted metal-binding protein
MESKTLFVCNGCCCGHEEKGNPKVKNEVFEKLIKDTPITIEKPYCLGPCHLANVVKVEVNKDEKITEHWFQRINTEEEVGQVVSFAKSGNMSDQLKEKLMF